jgi:hypothetical protein
MVNCLTIVVCPSPKSLSLSLSLKKWAKNNERRATAHKMCRGSYMNTFIPFMVPLTLMIWCTGGSNTCNVCPTRLPTALLFQQSGSSHSSTISWSQRLTLRGGGRIPAGEKRARRKQAEEQMKAGIGKSVWRRDHTTCLTDKQKRTEKAMDSIRQKAADLNAKVCMSAQFQRRI